MLPKLEIVPNVAKKVILQHDVYSECVLPVKGHAIIIRDKHIREGTVGTN